MPTGKLYDEKTFMNYFGLARKSPISSGKKPFGLKRIPKGLKRTKHGPFLFSTFALLKYESLPMEVYITKL